MGNLFECNGNVSNTNEIIKKNIIRQTRTFSWTSSNFVNGWNHQASGTTNFSFPNKILGIESVIGKKTSASGNAAPAGGGGSWYANITDFEAQTVRSFGMGMAEYHTGEGNVSGITTVTAIGY